MLKWIRVLKHSFTFCWQLYFLPLNLEFLFLDIDSFYVFSLMISESSFWSNFNTVLFFIVLSLDCTSMGSGGCWAYGFVGCTVARCWFHPWCAEHWQHEHFGAHYWLWTFWVSGCIRSKFHPKHYGSSWKKILFCKPAWYWLVEHCTVFHNSSSS